MERLVAAPFCIEKKVDGEQNATLIYSFFALILYNQIAFSASAIGVIIGCDEGNHIFFLRAPFIRDLLSLSPVADRISSECVN